MLLQNIFRWNGMNGINAPNATIEHAMEYRVRCDMLSIHSSSISVVFFCELFFFSSAPSISCIIWNDELLIRLLSFAFIFIGAIVVLCFRFCHCAVTDSCSLFNFPVSLPLVCWLAVRIEEKKWIDIDGVVHTFGWYWQMSIYVIHWHTKSIFHILYLIVRSHHLHGPYLWAPS